MRKTVFSFSRMKSNHQSRKKPTLPKPTPHFLDLDQLRDRWHCHRMTAYRRLLRFGIKPIKLSERAILFHASDVEKIEADCQ
jgi:hypothetical protein